MGKGQDEDRSWRWRPDSTVVNAGIHIFSEGPQRIALTSRLHPETHEFATMQ